MSAYVRYPAKGQSFPPTSDVDMGGYQLIGLGGLLFKNGGSPLNIGVDSSTSNTNDRRPYNAFLAGGVYVGNLFGISPPYQYNTTGGAGSVWVGRNSSVVAILGSGDTSVAGFQYNFGYLGFTKSTSATTMSAFTSSTDTGNNDVFFSTANRFNSKTDLLQFGADGSLTFLNGGSPSLNWQTDGSGDIGTVGHRPDSILVKTSIVVNGYHLEPSELNAGNSSTAITLDLSAASSQLVTMTGNCTFTLSNGLAGGSYVVRILAGTGGFTISMSNVTWLNSTGSGPAAPTSGKTCLINLYCIDGTNYLGTFAQNQ